MKKIKIDIHKNILLKYKFGLFPLLLAVASCQTFHPLQKHNYFNGSTLYNEPLEINVKYFGDINFIPLEDLKRKEIENKTRSIKEVAPRDLLAFGRANVNPEYEVLFFMKEVKGQEKDTLERTSLVHQDTIRNKVLYKKSKGNKAAYFLLEAINDNNSLQSITNDGLHLANSLSFDINVQEELTYSKIFERFKNHDNYLFVREKLRNAPIARTEQNEWMQFQYLSTINSFMSNNLAHSELLGEFEKPRKEYLQPILDTLLGNREIVKNTTVIDEITNLSKKTRIVMLNENHWYPKHRKLALQFLKPLRDAGYTHLALEALYKDQDSVINNGRHYPTFNSGYYTKEPFFAHLIRKAKDLGFIINGYENYADNINRELGQAKNLEKILRSDPTAKIFVYAGLDHIVEEPTAKGKRMAAYLKELTNINPLTINQVDLVSDIDYEMVLVPYHFFENDKKFRKKVDFFILNNLEMNFRGIYPETKRQTIYIPKEFSQKNSSKEFLVSVYNENEYSVYKSRSVPIISTVASGSGNTIDLVLPKGSFIIKFFSEGNNTEVITQTSVE